MTSNSIPQTVGGRRVFRCVVKYRSNKRVAVFERYHYSREAAVESLSSIAEEEGFTVLGVYEGSLSFTLNETQYRADAETLNVLRSLVDAAKATNDGTAVAAVVLLGIQAGRVTLVGAVKPAAVVRAARSRAKAAAGCSTLRVRNASTRCTTSATRRIRSSRR